MCGCTVKTSAGLLYYSTVDWTPQVYAHLCFATLRDSQSVISDPFCHKLPGRRGGGGGFSLSRWLADATCWSRDTGYFTCQSALLWADYLSSETSRRFYLSRIDWSTENMGDIELQASNGETRKDGKTLNGEHPPPYDTAIQVRQDYTNVHLLCLPSVQTIYIPASTPSHSVVHWHSYTGPTQRNTLSVNPYGRITRNEYDKRTDI